MIKKVFLLVLFFYTANSFATIPFSFWKETNVLATLDVEMFGAGGAGGQGGGGGGAGERQYIPGLSYGVGSYTVTIGTGGVSQSYPTNGDNGGNTVFDIYTAIGGGGGAGYTAPNGSNGGTGGGAATDAASTGGTATGTGDGFDGGDCAFAAGGYPSAGGGGTGSAGQDCQSSTQAGTGGTGTVATIDGNTYGCGGGGGASSNNGGGPANGGCSCGGNGSSTGAGGAGSTTCGGGGGSANGGTFAGGTGGNGLAMIRYLTGTATATGGTITTSGPYTIHTFTSSGTFQITSVP